MNVADRPRLMPDEATAVAVEHFGVRGHCTELPSERDQNFRIDADAQGVFVLKIAHPEESATVLDLQHQTLRHLAEHGERPTLFPRSRPTLRGEDLATINRDGVAHLVRLVTYLPGTPIAGRAHLEPALLHDIGRCVGDMDRALAGFAHPAMHRRLAWDSKYAFDEIRQRLPVLGDRRPVVERMLDVVQERLLRVLGYLSMQVIHNDVNDHNLLVDERGHVSGVIDFGDMVHSYRVCDLANTLAYLLLGRQDWPTLVTAVVNGYRTRAPIDASDQAALIDFIRLRLCLSVSMAASQRADDPGNAYLGVSEAPAWAALHRLAGDDGAALDEALASAPDRPGRTLTDVRASVLSRTLSLAYTEPLKIVRGEGPYLFTDSGERYLDGVNNVCHVGHCHPHVVASIQRQAAQLNTNTRYLHDHIVTLAERLTATMPDALSVCFFVNSGSEANDLALRLARAHTQAHDMIVLDHAYHGHTQALIEISPYKFNRAGGAGCPTSTHVVPMPDVYRGAYGADDPDAGVKYARAVGSAAEQIDASGRSLAGFIAESLPGVGGQIELPAGYLDAAYGHVRAAGGVCIADEVQVGFGRVGSHMWAFETQRVVPDIVTLGKPMGNGHPIAAVVTTRDVARSFENGMEYFNTFGGNPVSCAAGLAVLDVIEREGLQAHARTVGDWLLERLRDLMSRHALIGTVRGRGLFLGIELATDRASKTPAPEAAAEVVERMKQARVLLSTDGPFNNVIKFKPPMVFSHADAETLIGGLDQALTAMGPS